MDKEESLALFTQGRDAWNAWAEKMLTEREALEAAGSWTAGDKRSEWNDATSDWHTAAAANFAGCQFEDPSKEKISFSDFVFPDHVSFIKAVFSNTADFDRATFLGTASFQIATFWGGASFEGATFSGMATFVEAMFSGSAWFRRTTFSGSAYFDRSTFSDTAWFDKANFSGYASFQTVTFSGSSSFQGATFSGPAQFGEATFSSSTWFGEATFLDGAEFEASVFEAFASFDGACFKESADFRAIVGKSGFSLAGAAFLVVPDFIQAHFAEAPRLDNSRIQRRRFRWPTVADIKSHFKGDPDLSARWRALKRLAVQSHDHMHELEFFQNELMTRRWSTDRPWHAVFWFGLFYGWLSDFGRSIVRPLFWWAASALAFAPLYLGAHFDRTGKLFSGFGWTIDRFVLQPVGAAVAPPLHCLAGSGDPWRAALGISARKALLFFGLDSSDKLTQNYACLYGVVTQQPAPYGQLPANFYLNVPDSVIAFGIAQHIISAVLLFLLLLAIRNHFRIR